MVVLYAMICQLHLSFFVSTIIRLYSDMEFLLRGISGSQQCLQYTLGNQNTRHHDNKQTLGHCIEYIRLISFDLSAAILTAQLSWDNIRIAEVVG